MARHNREGEGTDQRGFEYRVSYQPDWLQLVKVTRNLESGRQSTMTLFKNPARKRVGNPPERVRTRIVSPDQDLDFEIAVSDPDQVVKRVVVECEMPAASGKGTEDVSFTILEDLPPPNGDGDGGGG